MDAICPSEMLMVEDNPADVLLAREAFNQVRLSSTFHMVEDGVQALKFLHHQEQYASAPRPDLILLDLNLPRKDGREDLAELKAKPARRQIPVVVLTTSSAEEDIQNIYGLPAVCYFVKPFAFEQLAEMAFSIQSFWQKTILRP